MPLLAAVIPFVVLLALTVVWRRPLWQSGLIAFFLAGVLWLLVPGITAVQLAPSVVKALLVSTEVGLILLGAISFLEEMNRRGTTGRIREALAGVTSGNLALEALLLAWLFCGFLEGAAGFGAPAALVAPLLHSLGFSPLLAATLPLVGDSAAVPFGAVGTPVRIGFDGLPLGNAAWFGAGINLLAGLVPPVAIYLLCVEAGLVDRDRRGIGIALWAGLCFCLPAFLMVPLGPEFPALAGALLGLLIFCFTLPKLSQQPPTSTSLGQRMTNLVLAFFPYLLLCVVLLLGKLLLGSIRYRFEVFDGTETLNAFQPGLLFLLTILLLQIGNQKGLGMPTRAILAPAGRRLPPVWLAIFCMAALAQFVVQLSNPEAALESLFGGAGGGMLLIILAPIAGTIGAFVAGSATVSNLLMAPLLYQASVLTGVSPGLVLGLQLVGAGAGNMISLQNLAAVQATVGLVNKERDMLLLLWRPCAIYLSAAILIGLGIGGVQAVTG